MKEKIKKILLWLVLIWFTLAFIAFFLDAVMIFLFGSTEKNPLIVISLLIISGAIVIKVQKMLCLRDLFIKKNKPK